VGNGPVDQLGYPLVAAFEMHDEGMEILRQRLRREHPDASRDEVESMVAEWLADRPLDRPARD
jgi:hypothetical protein